MKNESAVDASVVKARVVNVIVFNVSVGEDKTKILRQKRFCACLAPREISDTTSRRATRYRHRTARSKASNVKRYTSGHRTGLPPSVAYLTRDCADWRLAKYRLCQGSKDLRGGTVPVGTTVDIASHLVLLRPGISVTCVHASHMHVKLAADGAAWANFEAECQKRSR
jgi:hypothetical protein